MKIFLLKDVPRVGSKGDILDVAQAYGMNSFVNKGLARIATANDEKVKSQKEEIRKQKKEMEMDQSVAIMRKLENLVLVIKKKVDNKSNLYSKVDEDDVVDAIYDAINVSISNKAIVMQKIMTLGDYEVVATANGKKYKLQIKVVKDLN
jgi:large subunit ribosomal protein L9